MSVFTKGHQNCEKHSGRSKRPERSKGSDRSDRLERHKLLNL